MKENQSIPSEVKARRKFLAGIGLLSVFPFFKSGWFSKKAPVISCNPAPEKQETIKVLSREGKLVEVDVSKIKQVKAKISDQELQQWIKKQ
jgi:hypothetical protein